MKWLPSDPVVPWAVVLLIVRTGLPAHLIWDRVLGRPTLIALARGQGISHSAQTSIAPVFCCICFAHQCPDKARQKNELQNSYHIRLSENP